MWGATTPWVEGKPVGVQQKNLVITSNYAARAFGIKKGDSLQVVREKCPDITICNGEDLTFYGQISQQVFDVASRFSAKVEKLGLDEVFVDMTEQVDERLTDGKFDEGAIPIPVQGAVYPEMADVDKFSTVEAMCWKRLHVASQRCQEIREAILEGSWIDIFGRCFCVKAAGQVSGKLEETRHADHFYTN